MNSRQRRALADIYISTGGTDDWEKRFFNALRGLVLSDPKWMLFLERETSIDMPIEQITMLVEARAKAAALKPYRYMITITGQKLFNPRWQFTDRGTLPPG